MLPREVIHGLLPSASITSLPNLTFVDGTLGGAGHSQLILETFPSCNLLCIDRDVDALNNASKMLVGYKGRVHLAHGSYKDVKDLLHSATLPSKVHGILVDLGVSSHQIDTPSRGFSFRFESELDMRFDQGNHKISTAKSVIRDISEVNLGKIIKDHGEEPQWRRIATEICKGRMGKEICTTGDLTEILNLLGGSDREKRKRSSRVFQVH